MAAIHLQNRIVISTTNKPQKVLVRLSYLFNKLGLIKIIPS